MKKPTIGLMTLTAIAALSLTTITASAQAPQPEPPTQPGKAVQTFHGTVDAVDTTAKTLTVAGKVIYIADTTRITKQGQAIQLSEIAASDVVHGTAHMTFDGKTEALSVMVGPQKKEAPDKN